MAETLTAEGVGKMKVRPIPGPRLSRAPHLNLPLRDLAQVTELKEALESFELPTKGKKVSLPTSGRPVDDDPH
jgi:hypothetical protein